MLKIEICKVQQCEDCEIVYTGNTVENEVLSNRT